MGADLFCARVIQGDLKLKFTDVLPSGGVSANSLHANWRIEYDFKFGSTAILIFWNRNEDQKGVDDHAH